MRVWIVSKDNQSYGHDVICVCNSKKLADKIVKERNENKTELEAITGDFYSESYAVLSESDGK